MRKWVVETEQGHRYWVHENGNIERTDGNYGPSDTWRVVGIDHVQRRLFVAFPSCFDNREWTYKNGRGMWYIRDLDHGTMRGWGDHIRTVYPA